MPKILEKTERRLGEKLFVKGERCLGPKCAHVRRAYAPGMHGKKSRRRSPSLFATLLAEKQKIRFLYGLDDRDIRRYSREAAKMRGAFPVHLLRLLELRLDNAVYRLGIVESRRASRQLVSHGHVTVNATTVTSSSFRLRRGDIISLKPRIWETPILKERVSQIKKYQPPAWLAFDPESRVGRVVAEPAEGDIGITIDPIKIKEFYSR